MTLDRGVEWVAYINERRYEWAQILFGKKEEEPSDKPCRNAAACSMCRKKCDARKVPYGG